MELLFTCGAALLVLLVLGAYIGAKLGPSGKPQRQHQPPAHDYHRSKGTALDNRSLQAAMRDNKRKGVPRDNGY